MAKGVVLTPEEYAQRRCEIKNTALELFKEKGFRKTSMREISDAMGMGKSSLYDFFTSKDGIAIFAYEEATEIATQEVKQIIDSALPPDDCLRQIMKKNLAYVVENRQLVGWLNAEANYLEEEYQKRLYAARHSYQDLVQSVIEKGIDAAVFRETDSALATRLLINSMISIIYTSRPTGSLDAMLNEAMDIFLSGIKSV